MESNSTGGHAMSPTVPQPLATPAGARSGSGVVRPDLVAGAGGLVFFGLLVVDNLIRSRAPGFGASGTVVAGYLHDHRTAMVVPIALFPFGMVGLFAFISGLWSRSGAESRGW